MSGREKEGILRVHFLQCMHLVHNLRMLAVSTLTSKLVWRCRRARKKAAPGHGELGEVGRVEHRVGYSHTVCVGGAEGADGTKMRTDTILRLRKKIIAVKLKYCK